MNNQANTKVRASHDDAVNRVMQNNHIIPGHMIEYLESRRHYILCSFGDLKHEMSIPEFRSYEPGFYEKLFAELDAELKMVNSIIVKLKGEL